MMDNVEPIVLAAQILMGLTLAAIAGLRAFLPPFALGLAARADLVTLSEEFAWLSGTPVLIALGSAVAFELLGDKIPVVDNILDAAGTVLRPAAGALVATVPLFTVVASVQDSGTAQTVAWMAGLTGVVLGASVSTVVHLTKSQVRLVSTPLTAGLANPVISIVEDIVGFVGVALAILVPVLAFILLLLIVTTVIRLRRKRVTPQHG